MWLNGTGTYQATIEDNFSDPNKPLFCVRDHQIFLAKNLSHLFMPTFRPFEQLPYGSDLSICVKKQSFWDVLASRSQTKPEISPKIGAKLKASMILSQPYITLPYLSKKSGTSVDVKVYVKNMTERNRNIPCSGIFILKH